MENDIESIQINHNHNNMNTVSAIITTHNRCDLLRCAIESVMSQSYKDIECIVVDDASTDNTRQLCKQYNLKYVYISPEESRGGNYARNLGVKNSSGDYVAFLDDDDEWLPTKIEEQIKLAKEMDSSLVFCLRYYKDFINNKYIGVRKERNRKPSGNLKNLIFRHYITNTSCILAKKSAIEKIGGFDENLRKWQEYDLMIRMAEITDIYFVDKCLCNYTNNINGGNRISNDFDRLIPTIKYIRTKYSKRINNLSLKDRLYFNEMCIGDTYKLARQTGRHLIRFVLFLPYAPLYAFKKIDQLSNR